MSSTSLDQTAGPSAISGAIGGGLAVVAFTAIHDIWIVDIWFNTGPMVISGALCGLSIVWSYRKTTATHSWQRWMGYNAACALLLIGLGPASFLLLEPSFTMNEMMNASEPLAQLLPPAMPLMIGGTVIGTVLIWLAFGRQTKALLSMLVTQALLMFLVGHNLAILGLVEMPGARLYRVVQFVGTTLFLAFSFALAVLVVEKVSPHREARAESITWRRSRPLTDRRGRPGQSQL